MWRVRVWFTARAPPMKRSTASEPPPRAPPRPLPHPLPRRPPPRERVLRLVHRADRALAQLAPQAVLARHAADERARRAPAIGRLRTFGHGGWRGRYHPTLLRHAR